MAKIIECGALPTDEKVYLTKSKFFGYKVVYPIKNKDGSFNWKNFIIGSKKGLFLVTVYILIALLIWYGVNELVSGYRDVAENPCNYCRLSSDYKIDPDVIKSLSLTRELTSPH